MSGLKDLIIKQMRNKGLSGEHWNKDQESEKNIAKYAEKGDGGECDAVYPKYM